MSSIPQQKSTPTPMAIDSAPSWATQVAIDDLVVFSRPSTLLEGAELTVSGEIWADGLIVRYGRQSDVMVWLPLAKRPMFVAEARASLLALTELLAALDGQS